jgi:tetratricopeptide (TPR) repeat protein
VARQKLEDLVVEVQPTAVDAHLVLIGIAMQAQEYKTACDLAIRAIGVPGNRDNAALLSARGRAELALENTRMAVELARMVLKNDPNNTEALDLLADAARTSGDQGLLKEARTLLDSAAGSKPANERLQLARARVLVSLGTPQAAIPELEAYCQTEEGSGSLAALVTLIDLYRLAGDMDRAKQRIEQAERLAPNNQLVVHARFLWLVAQRRFEQLQQISAAYISATGQNPQLVVTAASILSALGPPELKKEALRLAEHALTLSPTSKDVRLAFASTLYQAGQAERAEKIYRELLGQYPNNVQVLNDLAWILQEGHDSYAEALELADEGLRLASKDMDIQHLLDTRGTILSKLPDRLTDARKDFEKLVELSPPDTRELAKALLQLGRICAKLNDLIQAEEHLKKALEIDRKIDVFTPDERDEIRRILQESEK